MKLLFCCLLPAVCCLSGCVDLSDAGTEGGKCFSDGECNEGLSCNDQDVCEPDDGSGDPCEGKEDGDECPLESGDKGECATSPDGLFCAAYCEGPGNPCPDGMWCYAAAESFFLCSKPGPTGDSAECSEWNDCRQGMQCVSLDDGERCRWVCEGLDDDCGEGATCVAAPLGFHVCVAL